MSQMKALYEKVSKDQSLQQKFIDIMRGTEADGKEVVSEKLLAFAKEAGYTVTMEEMNAYFKELTMQEKAELSESELDMVAGGKMTGRGIINIINSAATLVIGCIASSVWDAATGGNCYEIFDVTQ